MVLEDPSKLLPNQSIYSFWYFVGCCIDVKNVDPKNKKDVKNVVDKLQNYSTK